MLTPLLATGLDLLTDRLRDSPGGHRSLVESILRLQQDDDATPRPRALGDLLRLCRGCGRCGGNRATTRRRRSPR
ncbi:hypothetical protein AB0D62_29325 [Streptomyces massasporeus]|uniref:hypothetical protein n=1 Tax=Streptomyces massasporeus TaxID=67324 RepID=UPI0033D89CD9